MWHYVAGGWEILSKMTHYLSSILPSKTTSRESSSTPSMPLLASANLNLMLQHTTAKREALATTDSLVRLIKYEINTVQRPVINYFISLKIIHMIPGGFCFTNWDDANNFSQLQVLQEVSTNCVKEPTVLWFLHFCFQTRSRSGV